jgi:hypothetical protein
MLHLTIPRSRCPHDLVVSLAAVDALYCGIPVLVKAGRAWPERVATSLLTALDVDKDLVQSPTHPPPCILWHWV